jgi:Pescadillo N-terminus
MPFNVDYKVMLTFLEFYIALMKFVNHKLFADLGLNPAQSVQNAYIEDQFLNIEEVRKM